MNLDERLERIERLVAKAPNTIALELRTDPDYAEPEVIADMRSRGGLTRDEDVLRVALWSLALFLEVEMPAKAFALPYRPSVVTRRLTQEEERRAEQASLFEDGSMTGEQV